MKPFRRAFCGLALVAATACTRPVAAPQGDDASPAAPTSGVTVSTAILRAGTIPRFVSGYGSVSGGANARAALGFAEGGRIVEIDANVGDRVGRGTVLARLDPEAFDADVARARADVAAAEAARMKARAGVRPQQLAQTDVRLRDALAAERLAASRVAREGRLAALGISAQSDVENARAALATAHGDVDVLRLERSSEARPWAPDVAAADANVAQAKAELAGALHRAALGTLVAPFAGTVVARERSEGESVEAAVPVIDLASDAPPTFTAQFAPDDIASVHVGDVATIAEAGARPIDGRVVAIDPAQGDAHTVGVLLRFSPTPAERAAFGPGAYGRASIRVGTFSGLAIPTRAIVTDGATGAVEVFRMHGERFSPIPVVVTARAGDRAIVTSPLLRAGDRIATSGAYELLTPQQSTKRDND